MTTTPPIKWFRFTLSLRLMTLLVSSCVTATQDWEYLTAGVGYSDPGRPPKILNAVCRNHPGDLNPIRNVDVMNPLSATELKKSKNCYVEICGTGNVCEAHGDISIKIQHKEKLSPFGSSK